MTMDSIKVWVPALKGVLHWNDVDERSEEECWKYMERRRIEDRESMKKRGWTVRPYTITPIQEEQS